MSEPDQSTWTAEQLVEHWMGKLAPSAAQMVLAELKGRQAENKALWDALASVGVTPEVPVEQIAKAMRDVGTVLQRTLSAIGIEGAKGFEQGIVEVAKAVGEETGAGVPPFERLFPLHVAFDWVRRRIREPLQAGQALRDLLNQDHHGECAMGACTVCEWDKKYEAIARREHKCLAMVERAGAIQHCTRLDHEDDEHHWSV